MIRNKEKFIKHSKKHFPNNYQRNNIEYAVNLLIFNFFKFNKTPSNSTKIASINIKKEDILISENKLKVLIILF